VYDRRIAVVVGCHLKLLLACCLAVIAALAPATAGAKPARLDRLTLVVPAASGGGWDLTAKSMKAALEREGLVGQVSIIRYPGAGGLIGLSQFVTQHRGDDGVLLLGGLVMLSSAIRDESAVTLRDVTPIARLTGEWSMVAARADSPIKSMADLRSAMQRDPAALRWLGGALGGPDQGLVWLIARQLHVPLDEITYFGRAGGRRVSDALAEGRGDVAVSGFAEFARRIESGEFRMLGVAAPDAVAGIDSPTLRAEGLDVTMMNWRGVFGAPGISAAQQDRLTALIGTMARSPSWAEQLRANRWTDTYLDGRPLSQFLDREQTRWSDIVNPPMRVEDAPIRTSASGIGWIRGGILAVMIAALAAFAGSLFWQLRRRRRAALELERRCLDLADKLCKSEVSTGKLVKDGIDFDFDEWKLSSAESDIAWFMLRGLPMREIADLRGTSERTVRQQAQAIYRKAGLDGRSDLAGRVLERFI
jgi:putative tricarboxylic transport membrane protein